jgi:nucleoside-diphosphate-sugar epimerase
MNGSIDKKIALIIGATGGIGGATATALSRHGWTVRGLTRKPRPLNGVVEWIVGNAMNAAEVLSAARGVSLIVHAANPPGYRNWATEVLPMVENTIAAAKEVGARIVMRSPVYNYGADAFPILHEDSPQHPSTRKGAIRVELEKKLEAAAVPALIVRSGDYFGPTATGNSFFAAVMVRPGLPVRWTINPARKDASHAWAYLPDVAEAIAALLDRGETLGDFELFNFAGHQLASSELPLAIGKAVGNDNWQVWPLPWFLIVALQPFVPLFREMSEMRYLWEESISLDQTKLAAFLGDALPHTSLEIAVRDTLIGLGCMKEASPASGMPETIRA